MVPLGAFFRVALVSSFSAAGAQLDQSFPLHCGSARATGRNSQRKRFPWSGKVRPGFFSFQYTILTNATPSKPNERICGPVSKTIAATTRNAPFLVDLAGTASVNDGTFYATINPTYVFDQMRIDWSSKQLHST
jgi:hypothetical protein